MSFVRVLVRNGKLRMGKLRLEKNLGGNGLGQFN